MDTAKLLKTGLKTVNALAKMKFKTRRQKRKEMLTYGLIALGVLLVAVGSGATAVKMNLVPTAKIKRKAHQLKNKMMNQSDDEDLDATEFGGRSMTSNTGL